MNLTEMKSCCRTAHANYDIIPNHSTFLVLSNLLPPRLSRSLHARLDKLMIQYLLWMMMCCHIHRIHS